MKLEKWNEKAIKILEGAKDPVFINDETTGNAYFAVDKYMAYMIPGNIYSAKDHSTIAEEQKKAGLRKLFTSNDGYIADRKKGYLSEGTHKPAKVSKFETESGNIAFVNETFLKQFPKNTLYYISGETKPVYAGIWENGTLHIIAAIMPIRKLDRQFVEA